MFFIEDRIERFLKDVKNLIHTDGIEINNISKRAGRIPKNIPVEMISDHWEEYRAGTTWCNSAEDTYALFKTDITIPIEFAGRKVKLQAKTNRTGWNALNPQMLIYLDGKEYQGLDTNHTDALLAECAEAGRVYRIAIYAFGGITLNNYNVDGDESDVRLFLKFTVVDERIEKFYYDLFAPWQLLYQLPVDSIDRINILQALNEAVNLVDMRDPYSNEFYSSIEKAEAYIIKQHYSLGRGIGAEVTCIGHTHLDLAWLWRFQHTREKAVRSFSTALSLMDRFPEYTFLSSQPQLYEYIKEDHPYIFEKIKARISEGKWEAEGGMWVEADTNIPSGESLVRQFLFGKRYFMKEFGIVSKILWLPDVFGYNGNLPQIMKKSGVDYFMTAKLMFNEFNPFPYHTFLWKGIDGSEVLSHLVILGSKAYNGEGNAEDIMQLWKNYKQKDINNDVMLPCGYGDGGGGTTEEMLEVIRRFGYGLNGSPKTKVGDASTFFKSLDKRVRKCRRLPKWNGELYFERHRGTYTSMAKVKKMNRKAEFLFMKAELAAAINFSLFNIPYPREELNNCWKQLLLCQFHDILPGSSIKEVYEDTDKIYEEVFEIGNRIVDEGLIRISAAIKAESPMLMVFNPLSWEGRGLIEFAYPSSTDGFYLEDHEGRRFRCQKAAGEKGHFVCAVKGIAPKGYSCLRIVEVQDNRLREKKSMNISQKLLENAFYRIKLDKAGLFTSLFDKRNNREVLKPGEKGNVLQAFEDKPKNEDNWNLDIFYSEKMWVLDGLEEIKVLENGPVRGVLRIKRKFINSYIIQDIVLYENIPRIDFNTTIDWKEKDMVIKAAFPVDINANKADYEIQYGHIERSTHWNTSWDIARFEVCGHKWADLSEDGYGVSLLNDCKYGYDIHEGVMRLTLLRCGTKPNLDADKEIHSFRYSLYPHAGGWKEGQTLQEAYDLNCSLTALLLEKKDGYLPKQMSLAAVDNDNVILEVIKMAEDSNEVILRFYEAYNRRACVTVTLFRNIGGIRECDLMENELESKQGTICIDNKFVFDIKPFEIKTYKIIYQ